MDKLEALEAKVEEQGKEIAALKDSMKRLYTRSLLPAHMSFEGPEEAESLRMLLESNQWPNAVDSSLICGEDSEQDKRDRAEGILDLIIDVHLDSMSFLDFGCGEGHVVAHSVLQTPKKAIGYDIVESPRWEGWTKDNKGEFTTDWQKVKDNGPYNVVLMYDVIDHILGDNAEVIECLKKIRSVMTPNAKIFVRCHPWISRHATHLYHKINKAFIHLVFNEEELERMGYGGGLPTRQVIHPIITYSDWFRAAGLKQQRKEQVTKTPIEQFFMTVPLISQRIKHQYRNSVEVDLRNGVKFPNQLEFQFLDYVLVGA